MEDDRRAYVECVRSWRDQLNPTDFLGRLRAIVGKESFYHHIREDKWGGGSELDLIAAEIVATPKLLEENLDYLCSPDARSAGLLGVFVGRKDLAGSLLDCILSATRRTRSAALIRGYITGLLTSSPEQATSSTCLLTPLSRKIPQSLSK
jgi:hypothetical protein